MDSFDPSNYDSSTPSPINPGVYDLLTQEHTTDDAYFGAKIRQVVGEYSVNDAYKYVTRKVEQTEGSSRLLQPEEANSLYGIDGHLSFSQPVNEAYAKDLNRSKSAQITNEYLLSHGTESIAQKWGGGALGLGLAFADPSNIALAVIPVVGEARYLQLLGRAGKAAVGADVVEAAVAGRAALLPGTVRTAEIAAGGVRTALARTVVGAANNAGGALLLEPLRMEIRNQEQTDYGFSDSLTNVLEAGAMGGILHAGIGAFVDFRREAQIKSFVKGLREETRFASHQAAISDLMHDREVTTPVEIMKLDEGVHLRDAALSPEMVAKYPDVYHEVSPEFVAAPQKTALAQYNEIQDQMKAIVKGKGAREGAASPEYQALWKASEDLKNQHGGMPPKPVAEDYKLRIYRGETKGGTPFVKDSPHTGLWFTKELEHAKQFGDELKVLDLATKEDHMQVSQGHGGPREVVVSPELAARAKRFDPQAHELRKQAMRDDVRKVAEGTRAEALKTFQDRMSHPQVPQPERLTDAPLEAKETQKIESHEHTLEPEEMVTSETEEISQLLNDYRDSFSESDLTHFKEIDAEMASFAKEKKAFEIAFNCGVKQ